VGIEWCSTLDDYNNELTASRVFSADTFRYLKLLMDGGIYTDSDTSCVRPLSEWPGLQTPSPNAHILSDPLFTLAPYLLSLSPDKNPANPKSEEEAPSNQPSTGQADAGVLSGEMLQEAISASLDDANELPALVLAVKFDAPHTKADWKKRGYARSMQFVQVRSITVKVLNCTHVEKFRDYSGRWALNLIIQVG
jgi:alpha 1,6-mannosyltransferase